MENREGADEGGRGGDERMDTPDKRLDRISNINKCQGIAVLKSAKLRIDNKIVSVGALDVLARIKPRTFADREIHPNIQIVKYSDPHSHGRYRPHTFFFHLGSKRCCNHSNIDASVSESLRL